MHDFNPFDKSLNELGVSDLQVLKSVSEGWFLDYKIKEINSSQIGKHLCSFANTYGGWLFFGIGEKSKNEPVADSFEGIHYSDIENLTQKIKQAALHHCNPTPKFEVKQFPGPCEAIGLPSDRSIIAIKIPAGFESPYIHSSGRIYRRVNDASEPFTEIKDKHEIDQLYDRRGKIEKSLKRLYKPRDLYTNEYIVQPFLRLMFFASLDGNHEQNKYISFEEFRDLVKVNKSSILKIDYNSVFTIDDYTFCARHIMQNDASGACPDIRFRKNLQTEFHLPLNWYHFEKIGESYICGDQFLNEGMSNYLLKHNIENPKMINLSELFRALVAISGLLQQLYQKSEFEDEILVKAQFNNILQFIPYIDVPELQSSTFIDGVPVMQSDTIYAPSGQELYDFFLMRFSDNEDAPIPSVLFAIEMMIHFLPHLGFGIQKIADCNIYASLSKLWENNFTSKIFDS